jgi:electron transfer flavoprotein alpha subunit
MNILVYCEVSEGRLSTISTEILGGGKELANALGSGLSAVLIGKDAGPIAQEAISFGADTVYVIDDSLLSDYQAEAYLEAMERLVKLISPKVLIFGQTDVGRDLAPRLAFRLDTSAVLGCTELAVDDQTKLLLQTRPIYGGNAHAVFTTMTDPQVVTIKAKSMLPLEEDPSRKGDVIHIESNIDVSILRTRLMQRVKEVEGVKLDDARVIVSGGRGISGKDGFTKLEKIAAILKGAVGASRPPCDSGWIPSGKQIGLTGKVVAPDLYIAVAISGSTHHMSGCAGSKTIVAINKDREANIFRHAHFGVVGDWMEVLTGFETKMKEIIVE